VPYLVPAQDGCAPLYKASESGHVDVVKELLSSGAAIDQATEVEVLHCSLIEHYTHVSCSAKGNRRITC